MVDWLRDFKHQLSVVEAHTDDLPVGDFDVYTLSRETFQGLIHQQLQTTVDLCDRLVTSAGLEWEQVGRILLVGGSCRIPYVRQLLEEQLHRPVVRVDEPELAVCLGAAIYGDVTAGLSAKEEHLNREAKEREQTKAEKEARQLEEKKLMETAKLQQEKDARIQANQERQRIAAEENKKGQIFKFEVCFLDNSGKIIRRENKNAKSRQIDLDNGVILDMVNIPGGSFIMGEAPQNINSFLKLLFGRETLPQHQVDVPPFLMSKYPITQQQYQAIMGKNPSGFKGNNRPVDDVSFLNALEFCQKLSKRTNQHYRLPSEAEWEYACRAGSATPFHFGGSITTDLANYNGNQVYGGGTKGFYRQQTSEVGIFPPNAFGLYDMHGNVLEWCEDNWHSNYDGAPTDGSAWKSGGQIDFYVLRGGSWFNYPFACTSAFRCANSIDLSPSVMRRNVTGFRVVTH